MFTDLMLFYLYLTLFTVHAVRVLVSLFDLSVYGYVAFLYLQYYYLHVFLTFIYWYLISVFTAVMLTNSP